MQRPVIHIRGESDRRRHERTSEALAELHHDIHWALATALLDGQTEVDLHVANLLRAAALIGHPYPKKAARLLQKNPGHGAAIRIRLSATPIVPNEQKATP